MDAATWDRVKDLIADALERPPDERVTFLDANVPDAALLAEIRDLLKDYEDAPGFLESPLAFLNPEPETLPPGSQVGPYVIVRRLGAGGMGQVFLSHDDRLERKVALKRLTPSQIDPALERSRILSEAKAAARISHPNVAAVHDVIDHGGRIFIVMEFVEGESLAARLRREWLPPERVLAIGRQLAAALTAAHAQGVVHRDLKPSNIQITLNGSVKVLDFGIATASTPLSKLTTSTSNAVVRPGPVRGAAGTPEYMSPEQVQGLTVDERSDVFSLGLVLFEMVTGRRAFADMGLLERRATALAPVPRADALDPRVPREIADVIAKAVAIPVGDRFQSAAELDRALEALEPKQRTWKRRVVSSSAAVVVAGCVFGAVGFLSAAAFNLTLQRPFRFAQESIGSYIVVGLQANGMLMATAVLLTVAFLGAQLFVRLACLVRPIRDSIDRIRHTARRAATALGLGDPDMLARCSVVIGVAATVAIWVRFDPLLRAFYSRVGLSPADVLRPLEPNNRYEFFLFRLSVNLLLLSLAAAIAQIIRLRSTTGKRQGSAAVVLAVTVFVLTAFFMHVVPYRMIYRNDFEKVEYEGARCYLIGQRENDGLIYCPDADPPRHRVIAANAPQLRRSGVFESVFSLAQSAPSSDPAAPPPR
jgi:hypothetical protein